MEPKVESDHVEAVVVERQLLGVALDPFDLDAGLGGWRARLEQLGGDVEAGDLAAGAARRDRGVAGAAGDVENGLPLGDREPLDQVVADVARCARRSHRSRRPTRSPAPFSLCGVARLEAILCRSGALGQVLLELEHGREQIAVLLDPGEHLRGLEAE